MMMVMLVGSIGTAYAADAGSDQAFLDSYKKSFMESCVESSGGEQFAATCKCVLDDLLKNFSVAELKDKDKVSDYINKVAMGKCDK